MSADNRGEIIEENGIEAGREKSETTDFGQLLLLLLGKKGFVPSGDGFSLVNRNMGASEVVFVLKMSENAPESFERLVNIFAERNGFRQDYTGITYRFIHVADDYEACREAMTPVFARCAKICSDARIYSEFDVIDVKTLSASRPGGGKVRGRMFRKLYEEVFAESGVSGKIEAEIKEAETRKKEMKDELRLRAVNPFFNAAVLIIFINIAVFIADIVLQSRGNDYFTDTWIQNNGKIFDGEIWRLVTAMFMHADLPHLTGNMVTLFFLGTILLRFYDAREFLSVYFAGGIIGNMLTLFCMPRGALSLGASGAVMALGGTLIFRMFFGKYKKEFRKAGYCIAISFSVLFNLIYGLFTPGVNNYGHFGGFAAGFIAAWIIYVTRKRKRANVK